jgi:hypothetical protein
MASYRYRDPISGRFLNAGDVADRVRRGLDINRVVYEGGRAVDTQTVTGGYIVTAYGEERIGAWNENQVPWGEIWSTQTYDLEGIPHGALEPLNYSDLRLTPFPRGFSSYKVVYFVPDNPDYVRGYGMSDPLRPGQWPPDQSIAAELGASGIAAIRFY